MPFEPYALDVCYVVYKLRFYAYRFRTPLVGDTGPELPTCRAPQGCSKDFSRTLNFENDLQGKTRSGLSRENRQRLRLWLSHSSGYLGRSENTRGNCTE